MATPPPDQQNTLTGYCDVWNGYFIGTMGASLLLVGFNTFVSWRKDKFVSPGKLDWGMPWGIGLFLFNIALWNLLPPNIFFIIFKVALPNFNELAPQMACLAVQTFPIMTIGLMMLGFQIVFLYNSAAGPKACGPWICNDTDVQFEAGEERKEGGAKDPVVLLYGAPSRGRILCDRLEKRLAFEQDPANNTYIAPKTHVVLFNAVGEKERDFIRNNLEIQGVNKDRLYEFVTPAQVSKDNCFKLPYADNSVDKVMWSMFIREAAPIGSRVTPETIKAQKMAMMLDEVFRVLKPGGKFISIDSADRALLTYADCRDAIGESNVTMEKDVAVMRITLIMAMKMFKIVATKPNNFVSTGRMHLTKEEECEPRETDGLVGGAVNSKNSQELMENTSVLNPETGKEEFPDSLPGWKVMLLMLTMQIMVFFCLCFAAAALYMPLNIPDSVPLSQRAGNILPGIASSFASFAYFEREIVLNTMHFNTVGELLAWEIKGSTITVVLSLVLTALISVPMTLFQIGLASTGLGDTALTLIGIACSFIIGIVSYKYGSYKRNKSLLAGRNLDYDTYKQYF